MIAIVQTNTNQFSGAWHRRKPVSILTRNQPTATVRLGQGVMIRDDPSGNFERLLEPLTVHVEPRQRIRRLLGGAKKLRTVQTVAGVTPIAVKKHAHPR